MIPAPQNIYELHGRAIEANASLLHEYRKLLQLVQQIKDGKTKPEHVEINTTSDSWAIKTPDAADSGESK